MTKWLSTPCPTKGCPLRFGHALLMPGTDQPHHIPPYNLANGRPWDRQVKYPQDHPAWGKRKDEDGE